jgi:hypothetical protein
MFLAAFSANYALKITINFLRNKKQPCAAISWLKKPYQIKGKVKTLSLIAEYCLPFVRYLYDNKRAGLPPSNKKKVLNCPAIFT